MSRMTVRLPDTLHQKLERLAEQEGVSLNQYIVYALTQQSSFAYTITETPVRVIAEQRAAYFARQENSSATDADVNRVLAEREAGEAEPELTPELTERVKGKIARRKKSAG